MGKSKHAWYQDAVHIIRRYPMLFEQKRCLREQRLTANCAGIPSSSHMSRSIEQIATRQLSDVDETEYAAVERSIDRINLLSYGKEILAIINLVDWKKRKVTIAKAAAITHVSKRTAERYRRIFILTVAQECGWI